MISCVAQEVLIVAHYGFLTLYVMGHLFPMSTFARELQRRGHKVTFFCFADSREFLQQAGLDAVVIAEEQFPLGYSRRVSDALGQLSGTKGVTYTIDTLCRDAVGQFAALPDAIRSAGVDALILDQFAMAGATVGDHLQIPYIHIAAALMSNIEDGVPPINVNFGPAGNLFELLRNRLAMVLVKRVFPPLIQTINEQRLKWGLSAYTEFFNERFLGGTQICQEPPSFEFPRKTLPANFHFVGPLHRRDSRTTVPFPWERLDGRPLIYASMGTLQNGVDWVFKTFAEGCAGLDAQLVLSLGGNLDPANFKGLPGDPVVLQFAPQLELLERASLCITHAGLNTALESLAHGVPMVAIPITNDQPGVAARIVWTGAGKSLSLKKLNATSLREAVKEVMATPSYRNAAKKLQKEIARTDSLQKASEIAEGLLK